LPIAHLIKEVTIQKLEQFTPPSQNLCGRVSIISYFWMSLKHSMHAMDM
jgi:hypothetical protein